MRQWMVPVLALSMVVSGCASQTADKPAVVKVAAEKVASVNGVILTRNDYDPVYQQYAKMLNLQSQKANPMIEEMLKRLTLNKLILNTLLQEDAQKMGLAVSNADVQAFKAEQIKMMGGRDAFNQLLRQSQLSEAEFDGTLKEQVMINKFLEKKGGDNLKVNEKEAKEYFAAHKSDFDVPESVHARHILVKAIEAEMKREIWDKNPKISDDALSAELNKRKAERKAKAQELYQQVTANRALFGDLARKVSDDPVSAQNAGDLGPMTQKTLDPVFWEAVHKTKPGSLYPGVLETQFGYHIIEVKDHNKAQQLTFNDAKLKVMNQLEQEKKQKLLEQWVGEKRASAKINIEPAYQPTSPKEEEAAAKAAAGAKDKAPAAKH
jgi:peptidyl-prolyl cis-trans isomerase C